jgi:hypothetical protein
MIEAICIPFNENAFQIGDIDNALKWTGSGHIYPNIPPVIDGYGEFWHIVVSDMDTASSIFKSMGAILMTNRGKHPR